MATARADLTAVIAGQVTIEAPITDTLTQLHGFAPAGLVIGLADTARGYAALSLAPPGVAVLTVELKVNLAARA